MPKERPLWRGSAFRLCLVSAALFLCLQLGIRRSWCTEEKPRPAPEAAAAGRAPPPARGTEKHPAAAAGRRRVTYVRSGRRGSPGPGCCPLQPPGGRRRKTVKWHIELQPWASPTPSLDNEALRFLKYISTSQISCEHMNLNSRRGHSETAKKPWSICLDERFSLIHRIRSKQCRLYSLGLGTDDNQFETSMANSGCEVHRFDPSIKSAHIQEGQHLWYHRLSIDWRDPNPAIAAHKLHSNTKKLGTVLNEFGHQKQPQHSAISVSNSCIQKSMALAASTVESSLVCCCCKKPGIPGPLFPLKPEFGRSLGSLPYLVPDAEHPLSSDLYS